MACDGSMVDHVLVRERAPYEGTASVLLTPSTGTTLTFDSDIIYIISDRMHARKSQETEDLPESLHGDGTRARSGCHFLRVVRGCRAQRGPRSTDSRFLRDRKNGNIRVQQSLYGITFASDYKSLCIIDRDRLRTILIKK